jgi:hypothetical protein
LALLVDGVVVLPQWSTDGELRVELKANDGPAAGGLRRHTVELWWPETSGAAVTQLQLTPPNIADAWVRQVYWHVVLPRERMALATPAGMLAEMVWSGPWWQTPRLTQPQLEAWSGATTQTAPSTGQFNSGYRQYLYSSVGQVGDLQLTTQSTAFSMFGLSALALAAALTLMYVPQVRHGAVLIVAGAALLGLALWWPTLGVLAAQCAALGLAVFIAARLGESLLLRRRASRRPIGSIVAVSPSAARRRRPAEILGEPSPSRPSTTATAAMSLPLASEAKP